MRLSLKESIMAILCPLFMFLMLVVYLTRQEEVECWGGPTELEQMSNKIVELQHTVEFYSNWVHDLQRVIHGKNISQ